MKLKEIDYKPIDKRMRPLVRLLRKNGFNTLACCEGGKGHPHPAAWIRLTLDGMIEGIPMKIFPGPKMKPWYREFERLLKFVYGDARWPADVKIFTFAGYETGKKADNETLKVFICLDIEFHNALRGYKKLIGLRPWITKAPKAV